MAAPVPPQDLEVLVPQEDVFYSPTPSVAVSVRSSGGSSYTDTASWHSCQEQQHEVEAIVNCSSSEIDLKLQLAMPDEEREGTVSLRNVGTIAENTSVRRDRENVSSKVIECHDLEPHREVEANVNPSQRLSMSEFHVFGSTAVLNNHDVRAEHRSHSHFPPLQSPRQFILHQPLGLEPPSRRLYVRRLRPISPHPQTVPNSSPCLLLPSIPVFQRRLNGPVMANGMVFPDKPCKVICQYHAEYQLSKRNGNVLQIAGQVMGSPVSIDLDSIVDFRELTNTDCISCMYLPMPLKNFEDHLYDAEELLSEVCSATGVQPAVMDNLPYVSQAVVIPTVWETADLEAKKPAFSKPCLHMTARIVFSHHLGPLKSPHILYHFVDLQALIIDVQDGNEGE